MYYYGRGVPRDYIEAVRWCRKAAEQGYAHAEYLMGSSYLYGNGVPQDDAEAVRWYRKAAEQADPKGELGLAAAYYYGKGVRQDYAEAVRWYRKSAEQGDAAAQFSLGSIYSRGPGVPQDYTEAISWYRKAASQGDAGAEYALGYMYYNGTGLPRDYNEALRWLHASADHGSNDAQLVLRSLEKRSTRSTIVDYSVFVVALIGGLIFLLDPLLGLRPVQIISTMLGVVCWCYAGLNFYAITHADIRYSACSNLFYLTKGIMIGVVLVLGMIIIMSPTKKRIAGDSKPVELDPPGPPAS